MWKKVNLAGQKNLAAVAGQRRQILVEKFKKGKKVFPFNNLALLNLDFGKKIAKKGKKKLNDKLRQAPSVS